MVKYIILLLSLVVSVLSQMTYYPSLNEYNTCFNCKTIGWHCYLFNADQKCIKESNTTTILLSSCPTVNSFYTIPNSNTSVNMDMVTKEECQMTYYQAEVGEPMLTPDCGHEENGVIKCIWYVKSNANTLSVILPCLFITLLSTLLLF